MPIELLAKRLSYILPRVYSKFTFFLTPILTQRLNLLTWPDPQSTMLTAPEQKTQLCGRGAPA